MSVQLSCPSCSQPMEARAFPRALGGEEWLDICWSCQGIWFDAYESTQLAPAGVVELFQVINEHHAMGQPLAGTLGCPRCQGRLELRHDLVKSGRMAYYHCTAGHGRFTPFTQFMIEKGFVRALTLGEINRLKAQIQTIRCSGCGAPVDVQRDTVCGFCHAPIAVLDTQAVEKALAAYSAAGQPKTLAAHDVVAEMLIYHERHREEQLRQGQRGNANVADLISSSLDAILRRLG